MDGKRYPHRRGERRPPTGKNVRVDAISIHRMRQGKIAETWEVSDTLGFVQQLGVVPAN